LSVEMSMKTEKLFDPYQVKLSGMIKVVTYSTYILKFKSVKKTVL